MASRHYSLLTATNIRRTTSSLSASINRYIREQEKKEALDNALRGYYQLKAENDVFTTIHENLEYIRSVEKALKEYKGLVLEKYERKVFDIPEPDINSARTRVEKEARKQIHSIRFWTNKARRQQFVEEHLSERLVEYIKEWESNKELFEKEQDNAEIAYNEVSQAEYDKAKKELESFLVPSDNVILNRADKMLSQLELPFDISTKLSFNGEDGTLLFDIEFSGNDFIPSQKGVLLKSGKLSVKEKTQKERNYDYVLAICGTAYKIASYAFNISARVSNVEIYGRTRRMNDKTATYNDDYLYAVVFDRSTFVDVTLTGEFVPHEAFSSFPHKLSLSTQYVFKAINPEKLDAPSVPSHINRDDNAISIKIPGSNTSLKLTISSNIPNDKSNPNRAFSPDDGSGFDYLGYHDWSDIVPSDIVIEDSSSIPEWEHMYVYSRSDINRADKPIQEAYLQIRGDFLKGKFYDLSGPGKTNYGFVLFFDLFAAYASGKSDIQKLCKELDVLSIICGKTERYIRRTFENCFKEVSKPQEDKNYVNEYFNYKESF